ncbi:hypothetical protein GALMADRAFT_1123352 [Galerina marginata CBS 339.88]|uniref:Uncharacterized protein n=1 Tax=Galerina marginata (strain CBS 339.88) TaxID=685588 RepID=A0A067TFN6_GALM3|nr:hypothetical protein GALMADRAFT_1123352 [Galerina marginata CBS 339.88]
MPSRSRHRGEAYMTSPTYGQQMVPMPMVPMSAAPQMLHPTMSPYGGGGYAHHGAYQGQPAPAGSANWASAESPSAQYGNARSYRPPTPPHRNHGSTAGGQHGYSHQGSPLVGIMKHSQSDGHRRARSLSRSRSRSFSPPRSRSRSSPRHSPSSRARSGSNTFHDRSDRGRDGPLPLPSGYVPASPGRDGRSRGLHDLSRSMGTHVRDFGGAEGHHRRHREREDEGHGHSRRHRSSSHTHPTTIGNFLSPTRPTYSRRRSRSLDEGYMQTSRSRARPGNNNGNNYPPVSYGGAGGYQQQSSQYPSQQMQQQQPYQGQSTSHHSRPVIQQSDTHPVVVPTNGGRGGWVVIPPRKQTLHVVDPSQMAHTGTSGRHHRIFGSHSHSRSHSQPPRAHHAPSQSFFSRFFGTGKKSNHSHTSRVVQAQPVQHHYPLSSGGRKSRRRRESY